MNIIIERSVKTLRSFYANITACNESKQMHKINPPRCFAADCFLYIRLYIGLRGFKNFRLFAARMQDFVVLVAAAYCLC